jgi:hypothetical protein
VLGYNRIVTSGFVAKRDATQFAGGLGLAPVSGAEKPIRGFGTKHTDKQGGSAALPFRAISFLKSGIARGVCVILLVSV